VAVLEYSQERTVDPTEEPLTVDEVAAHVEYGGNDHDEKFVRWIRAAREQVEYDTDLALVTQTWVQRLDRPPETFWRDQNSRIMLDDLLFHLPGSGISRWLELQKRPVQSLTSITYLDTAGDSQTMSSADYELDTKRLQPVVWLAYNASWPATRGIQNSLAATYIAGYGARTAVPQMLKQAMLMQIYSWFSCRGMNGGETRAYDRIIHQHRRPGYP